MEACKTPKSPPAAKVAIPGSVFGLFRRFPHRAGRFLATDRARTGDPTIGWPRGLFPPFCGAYGGVEDPPKSARRQSGNPWLRFWVILVFPS